MSFPTMTTDRNALRNALRTSLRDVLADLGVDNRSANLMGHPNGQGLLALRQSELSPITRGSFDSSFLASRQQALMSQRLGLTSPSLASVRMSAPLQAAACSMGPSTMGSMESIMLAAAAANERSKLLEQVKTSLIQQHLAEDNRRLMLQKSYLNLIQNKGVMKHESFLPQLFLPPNPPATASRPCAGGKTLEALGSNLRSKTDPYIDVSNMKDPDPEDSALSRTRGGVSEPFPEKLHRMLQEIEKDGISDVVSFFSHGRAFGVHDMERFVADVMPKYFKQSKWNSFARQLNLYGFIRITSGPDTGGYYHELFLKGRPSLSLHMRRVGVPQGEDRRKFRPKNKNVEPDFYSMKRISSS